MKNKNKAVITAVCAFATVAASVFGTMAYFTSQDMAVNTFTVGSIEMFMDELEVNEKGETESADPGRVTKNDYVIFPGHTYIKDPILHVKKSSESCYLFVEIDNGIKDMEFQGENTIEKQMTKNGWGLLEGSTTIYSYVNVADTITDTAGVLVPSQITNVAYLKTINGVEYVDIPVFATFTIDGENVGSFSVPETDAEGNIQTNTDGSVKFKVTKEYKGVFTDQLQSADITVKAYAVQAEGFDTPQAAWDATFGKKTAPSVPDTTETVESESTEDTTGA